MKPRSKKYVESRKAPKKADIIKPPKVNSGAKENKPAKETKEVATTSIKRGQPEIAKVAATQDDTGGGNDSGLRSDDN
jgi:hypothetical protein